MARYAYDVDTTQRYIDVHKQFQGGLKTVDTDDALGAVFLRQAENVSISEFGFLEKRYGTYENFKQTFSGNLQGYWEFEGYIIYAVDGDIFVNGTQINNFHTEAGLRYPTNDNIPFNTTSTCAFVNTGSAYLEPTLASVTAVADPSTSPNCGSGVTKISCVCENFVVGEGCVQWSCQNSVGTLTFTTVDHFQRTRDMNAVNVNKVLYIFTGTYPIYAKVEKVNNQDVLKFYLFPVTVPTFDEIVVTGHNLLEDDYEGLYFDEASPFPIGSIINLGDTEAATPIILDSSVTPRFPYTIGEDSGLKFNFKIEYNADSPVWGPNAASDLDYYEIKLESLQYRTTGPGASLVDFIDADLSKTDFVTKSNYHTGSVFPSRGSNLITQVPFDSTKFSIAGTGSSNERAFYEVSGAFEVSRTDFLKYTTYGIEFLQFNNTSYTSFLLSQFANPSQNHFKRFEITPVDFNGNILSNEKISFAVTESNSFYKLPIPTNLNKNLSIDKYIIEFFVSSIEIYGVGAPQGPVDMQTEPQNYSFSLFPFESKSPSSIGNRISTTVVPRLDFKLSELAVGNYDFKVRFLRERFLNEGGTLLVSQDKEYFETILFNVTITTEKLQDYPGAIDYPTLKPIWTCNKVTEHFSKLMVWGSTAMPTAVFYSFPDRPTYFPSKFFLDFTNDQNSPVEAVSSYMNILVVQTRDQTWGVRGNSGLLTAPAPYAPFTINPTVGTIAYKSVRAVRNHLFFLSKQGIIALKSLYAADEQYNIEFVDRNIVNIVPRDDRAVGIQYDNQYWLNFPSYGITLRWYIDKKAWVKDTYTAWQEFNGVFKYQIVDGKLEFITRPSLFEGQNLGVYKIGIEEGLPSDLLKPIVSKFETSFLNQNYPFHPKRYKELKLDFTLQNEYVVAKAPIALTSTDFTNTGLGFTTQLKRNHIYQIVFDDFEVSSTSVEPYDDEDNDAPYTAPVEISTISLVVGGVSVPNATIQNGAIQFVVPASLATDTYAVTFSATGLSGVTPFSVFDVTYDHEIDFDIVALSERDTLLVEEYTGYTPTIQIVDQNLGTRFGKIEFGNSGFGSLVTAVETIKLTGSGYNSKIFFEDSGKIKWTMESLGITYKMRRARSRI
jgi:hypothetical protein